MSALIDELTASMNTLLQSGQSMLASTLRLFQAKVIAAIAVLEARARGNRIFYAAGVPDAALGLEGDLGVNKSTGDFFEFTGGAFVFLFNAKPSSGGGGGGGALAPATPTTLGGVIVGNRLTVDASGKISAQIATSTALGVMRPDNNTLTVDPNGILSVNTSPGSISPAATPTNLTAVRQANNGGTLISWDQMPGATFYQAYRSVNGGPFAQIAGQPHSYYLDQVDTVNQYVRYFVVSANSAGQSPASTYAIPA